MDHAQAMREMQRARVLLLLLNDTANAKDPDQQALRVPRRWSSHPGAVGPKDGDVARC